MRKLLFAFLLVLGCGGDMDELPPCATCIEGNGRCDGREFSLATEFCSGSSIYDKCGGKDYDPSSQFCYGDTVYGKCSGEVYDTKTYSCYGGKTYSCNNQPYDAANKFCYGDALYSKCAGREYNLSTEFCSGNTEIHDKCGGKEYSPSNEFCYGDAVYGKCHIGEKYEEYNPETQFCRYYYTDNRYHIEILCGSAWYEPAMQRCENGIVETKCGANWYDASSMQLCSGGTLRSYKTVEIGEQVWMAENLNYSGNGNGIGRCYDNNEANCDKYGRLYGWTTAMNLPDSCEGRTTCQSQISAKHQGICPSGWHIPSRDEWIALASYVESDKNCTGCDTRHLNAASGWDNCGPSGSGNSNLCEDSYGFSALPGGYSNNYFRNFFNGCGYWWTTTGSSGIDTYYVRLCGSFSDYNYTSNYGGTGYYVRCVRDDSSLPVFQCGTVAFTPLAERCCGNSKYTVSKQRCGESNVIETKCGTSSWYDSTNTNLRCYGSGEYAALQTKCGSGWYDASNSNLRCQSSVIETKCGSDWYDATNTNLRCQSDVLQTKCGYGWYDATTQRCGESNVIETKCGSEWYKASNANRCENSVIETKCGSGWYDTSNANFRCQSSVVEAKCGSVWYDVSNANLRCESGVIEGKCGSNWYDASNFGLHCEVSYEGETYKAVLIGVQVWLAKNLNYDPGTGNSQCSSDLESNCAIYGRLYDWSTAMALSASCSSTSCSSQIDAKHRGICPSGWHIPSGADWNALMKFVNPSCSDNSSCAGAGTKLKSASGWNSYSGIPAGTDDYGFAALPGGFGYSDVIFDNAGDNGYWWSSGERNASFAYTRIMRRYNENASWENYGKSNLYSVRCLQD